MRKIRRRKNESENKEIGQEFLKVKKEGGGSRLNTKKAVTSRLLPKQSKNKEH